MALSACVSQVLRTLSTSALSGLCAALQVQRGLIATEKTKRELQSLQYNVHQVVADAQQAAVSTVLTPIEDALTLYPSNFARSIPNCPEIGTLLTSPQNIIGGLQSISDAVAIRTREISTLATGVTNRITELTNLDTLLADTCTLIDNLIVEMSSG